MFIHNRRLLAPARRTAFLAPSRLIAARAYALYGRNVRFFHWSPDRLPGIPSEPLGEIFAEDSDDADSYGAIVSAAPVVDLAFEPEAGIRRLFGWLRPGGSLVISEQQTQARDGHAKLRPDSVMQGLLSQVVTYDPQVRARMLWPSSFARSQGVDFGGLKQNARPLWWMIRGQ